MLQRLVSAGYRQVMEVRGDYRAARELDNPGECLAILMYHGIEDRARLREINRQDIASTACVDEIRFFRRQGYQPVAPGEWPMLGGGSTPKLLVTFDDANLNTFDLLRHLAVREEVPVLVAVCPHIANTGEPFWYEEVSARIGLSRSWIDRGPRDPEGQPYSADRFMLDRYFGLKRLIAEVLGEVRTLTGDVTAEQVGQSDVVHANMDWEHLAALVETGRCTIAAHSMSHEAATHMSPDDFERDAIQCRETIEARLGIRCLDYVYPFGSTQVYSERTEAILKRAGYQRSYTTVHRLNRSTETMALGRFTGTGLDLSPGYYRYLWNQRHATADGHKVSVL